MRTSNLAIIAGLKESPWDSDWNGLNDTVILNPHGPVSFQWTDFHETCLLNQARLKNDPIFKAEYDLRVTDLERLKGMPVWLRAEGVITQTTLYALYADAIFQRLICGQQTHALCDVSFIAPSGPYKNFAISDCFNPQTYQDFVQVFLLQGRLPQRDFRLRVPSRLLIEYGLDFSEAGLVDLQQITAKGLLFKCPSVFFLNHMRPYGKIRLLMKSSCLTEASDSVDWQSYHEAIGAWNANAFYTQNKQEAFLLKCDDFQVASRFDFGQTQMVYLFVDYSALGAGNEIMAQHFQRFAEAGRSHMQQMLKWRVA